MLKNRRGSGAMEFAIIGSALMMLIISIIEAFMQLAAASVLEYAALRASRFGITGSNTVRGVATADLPGSCRSQIIPWIVNYVSGGFLRSANLTVTTTIYSNLSAGVAAGTGTSGAGSGGAIVGYTLTYTQAFITPLATAVIGRANVSHTTSLLVKNEPFDNATC